MKVPSSACPTCCTVLNGATGMIDDSPPAGGSLTVCRYCGELLRFDEDLHLVKLTTQEIAELPAGEWSLMMQMQRLAWEIGPTPSAIAAGYKAPPKK